MPKRQVQLAGRLLLALSCCLAIAGCGGPNSANVALRRENQKLADQVKQLNLQHDGDQRVIAGLRERQGSILTLPTTRLAQLYTTHSIEFGRLTGGANLDPAKPGDEGLLIYAVPYDQDGQVLKAAGSFDIEAFDLAEPANQTIGKWHFGLNESKAAWNGTVLTYWYVLTCPWQTIPRHPDITIRMTFVDELTQTQFSAQRVIHVNLPPAAKQR